MKPNLNDLNELDQPFNPKKTTLKDYMKFLIEQVEELKIEQKKTQDKVTMLEKDMTFRNMLNDEKQKRNKHFWAIVAMVGGAIGFLVDTIINMFTK